MNPPMYQRVRNMFGEAGLTNGFLVQLLNFNDPKDLSKAIMVFRPNGGTPSEMTSGTITMSWSM